MVVPAAGKDPVSKQARKRGDFNFCLSQFHLTPALPPTLSCTHPDTKLTAWPSYLFLHVYYLNQLRRVVCCIGWFHRCLPFSLSVLTCLARGSHSPSSFLFFNRPVCHSFSFPHCCSLTHRSLALLCLLHPTLYIRAGPPPMPGDLDTLC